MKEVKKQKTFECAHIGERNVNVACDTQTHARTHTPTHARAPLSETKKNKIINILKDSL